MKIFGGKTKEEFAWAFYDWANSVYSLVITTAIFPIYFGAVLSKENVSVFGLNFSDKDILYSYSITASFVLVVILSPILSALSDRIGNKKIFLQIFTILGALGCSSLFFFRGEDTLWIGILGSVTASLGYWGSLVFYNAYLPEITAPENQDKLSATGFIYGYIGSAILLKLCLVLILGVGEHLTPYAFLLVGVWWIGFAQYTFAHVPKTYSHPEERQKASWYKAHHELYKVGRTLMSYASLKWFLLAFFFLSVGIQTINYMASRFGDEELKLESSKLIITILVIQYVAVIGSYTFARLSKRFGNLNALQIGLLVWAGICIAAFLMRADNPWVEYQFYALGAAVGMVLGGVQALTRSTYSKLLPKSMDNATFFSFYDIVEKIALILGSFTFAQVLFLTGSMQYSALTLAIFFIAAIAILQAMKSLQRSKNQLE
ncbi:MAG: MFS transporter [Weeksellaceae bacterium]|nr:MFS transporter [Weeksellaceae bacterium]